MRFNLYNNVILFQMVESWEKYILWLLWWVGLGVLSSVGLGTGLHTFLIYLGPHIAQVSTIYILLEVLKG